jgi:hypothetical protein
MRTATAPRPLNPDRAFLAVVTRFDFEGHKLAHARANAIVGEGGDMNKDFIAPLGGSNESKSTIIIPFGQVAVNSHAVT